MIHAYAIDPAVAATWSRRSELRFIRDKFGIGTPRVMLEIPKFSKWKKAVYEAAQKLELTDLQRSVGLVGVFKVLGEHRTRRPDSEFDGTRSWIENAVSEFERHPFEGIVAAALATDHEYVLSPSELGVGSDPRWDKRTAATPTRQAREIVAALSAILHNSRELHLVDPYFQTDRRSWSVFTAIVSAMSQCPPSPVCVTVHCSERSGTLKHFEQETARLAETIPRGAKVRFRRWESDGEYFHDRFVLTELGGVMATASLMTGQRTHTTNLNLLDAEQYRLRWSQFTGSSPPFSPIDEPATIIGRLAPT